ncbi:MAG: YfiR family protein [Vicinamibacterales bacterium]
MIYKLVKFVVWPEPPSSTAPLHLCVYGADKVFNALTDVARGQRAQDRPLVVRRADERTLGGCHAVFIGTEPRVRMEFALRSLSGRPVLTVGEGTGFTKLGGMVNLVREGRHIRMEISRRALRLGGLNISSLVLALAQIVE